MAANYTSREGSLRLAAVGRSLGQNKDTDARAVRVLAPDHVEESQLRDRHRFDSWQSRGGQSTCRLELWALVRDVVRQTAPPS
jgi:hypothetical protein